MHSESTTEYGSIGIAVLGHPLPGERCHMMLAPFPGDPPEQCDRDAECLDRDDGLPYCRYHSETYWDMRYSNGSGTLR